jgi:type I restriction enzyme R subunit
MTEFKQIIGRGTRVHEDTNKYFFTIMDFRGATNHFADPEFDGDPVQVYEPGEDDPAFPPEDDPTDKGLDDETPLKPDDADEVMVDGPFPGPGQVPAKLQKVHVNGVAATILGERVEYVNENGKLVTETLRDFTKKTIRERYASLDQFLNQWSAADRKQALIDELFGGGPMLDSIADEVGKDLDAFDLICHVAFDRPPPTRRERAENVRKRDVFTKYGPQARAVLEALLQKYQDTGAVNIDDVQVLKIPPFDSMGTPLELVKTFGSKDDFARAVHDMQAALYSEAM